MVFRFPITPTIIFACGSTRRWTILLSSSRFLPTACTPAIFGVYNDGQFDRKLTFQPGKENEIVVRVDWQNGSHNVVELACLAEGGSTPALRHESNAPEWGGYWDSRWRYYGAKVVEEYHGIARFDEPIHLLMGVYADRLADPEREVRVVAIDPASGVPQEIPCQVYGVSTWDKRADEHCQPTTTFEVAFFASVPANTARVYLIFYGNSAAAVPHYPSDLVVSGVGLDAVISNSHYQISLHPKSGVIDEILLKQGVNVLFDHHLETNGAVHWNPGVYAPPRTWIHTSDWDPPAGHSASIGPIFAVFKRWGPMPEYPEVECSITYTFYANQPYVLMTSTIDVRKDIDVQALRNGEIVLNQKVVKEFAWKKMNGDVGAVVIKERPRHPTRALDLDAKTPWWAFYNRDIPCALAAINLELTAVRRSEGMARWEPFYYLHWGPWVYCARPLIYTFATPRSPACDACARVQRFLRENGVLSLSVRGHRRRSLPADRTSMAADDSSAFRHSSRVGHRPADA